MMFPIVALRGKHVFLHFERTYVAPLPVISLGSDCHPAFALSALGIRGPSFPFDWLYTKPLAGLDYAISNIELEFRDFVSELGRNDAGNTISRRYPQTEFLHAQSIIDDPQMRETLRRRAARFMKLFRERDCAFLYNINCGHIATPEDARRLARSAEAFCQLGGARRHRLLLYVSCDSAKPEDAGSSRLAESAINQLPRARAVLRWNDPAMPERWRDKRRFAELLASLGLELKRGRRRVFLRSTFGKPDAKEGALEVFR